MRIQNQEMTTLAWKAAGAFAIALLMALALLLSGGIGGSGGSPATAEAGCGKLKVRPPVVSR